MITNSTGLTMSTIKEYLAYFTEELRKVYGQNYVIKKEGVIDNFATASSKACLLLEEKMAYLEKQRNPYTAEGEFQDNLYAQVGLERKYADYTVVSRTIQGVAGTVCNAGEVRIRNTSTSDIFELNTGVTIGDDGTVVGSFTAIELGGIELDSTADLEIINAPDGVKGVYYTEDNVTTVGDDFEDDSEFRARWIATNAAQANSNTQGGLYTSLLPLVKNLAQDLVIRQNRNEIEYEEIPKHTMNIVIHSGESDETIARTIFNNLTDGVGLAGKVTVVVQDDEGTDKKIKFTRATEVPIFFKVEIALQRGIVLAQVERTIQETIVNNFAFAMGEKVVANDFYNFINDLEGIDYVNLITISPDGETYGNVINMDYDEFGTVKIKDVVVNEVQ